MSKLTGEELYELKKQYNLTYKSLSEYVKVHTGEELSLWGVQKRISRYLSSKIKDTVSEVFEETQETTGEPSAEELEAVLQLGTSITSKLVETADRPVSPPVPSNIPSIFPRRITPPEERMAKLSAAAEMLNELMEEDDPISEYMEKDFQTDQVVGIIFASCFHLGGRYTYMPLVRNVMNSLLNLPNMYQALMGDNVEGFAPWFFNAASNLDQALNIRQQQQLFMAFFDQTKYKTIAGWSGQHDGWWLEAKTGSNPYKKMFIDEGIHFFDGQGYMILKVGNQQYLGAGAHKFPGHSKDNIFHAHVRARKEKFQSVDFIVKGDSHVAGVAEEQVPSFESKIGIRPPWVHYIQTGTAKNGPDNYTMRSWSRGQSEYYIALFNPLFHEMRVTRHIDEAVRLLKSPYWYEGLEELGVYPES